MGNKNISAKLYLILLLSTFLLPLGASALVNIFIDPFLFFHKKTIVGFNHYRNHDFFASEDSYVLNYSSSIAKQNKSKYVIVGTSRILYGTDTCNSPTIQKIAMHGIQSSELLKITENLFENESINTLLIELAWTKPKNTQTELSLASFLFGLRTTKISFEILVNSKLDNHIFTTLNCYSNLHYPPFIEITEENKVRFDPDKFLSIQQLQLYSESIRKIINICDEKQSKVKIVFFMAPNLQEIVSAEQVNQAIKFLRDDLNNHNKTSCNVVIADYNYNLPDEFSEWFDVNHFKPSIGNKYLDDLLNSIDEKKN